MFTFLKNGFSLTSLRISMATQNYLTQRDPEQLLNPNGDGPSFPT